MAAAQALAPAAPCPLCVWFCLKTPLQLQLTVLSPRVPFPVGLPMALGWGLQQQQLRVLSRTPASCQHSPRGRTGTEHL